MEQTGEQKLNTVGEEGETNLMSSNVGTVGLKELKMQMDDAIKGVDDLSEDDYEDDEEQKEDYLF